MYFLVGTFSFFGLYFFSNQNIHFIVQEKVDKLKELSPLLPSGAGLGIRKESDANTVETALLLRERMDEIAEETGVEFYPFFDQGKIIESALDNLINAALTGGLFAIVVLYFFLRNLSTLYISRTSLT